MIGDPLFSPASPATIRLGTAMRLAAVTALKNVYTARTAPGQDSQMPYAIVWNAGERTEPNGDANVGSPSFFHTLTLVIDIVARAIDDVTLDTEIVNLVETVRTTLMTDPTWVALFEGIERCDTRYSYPKEATDIVVQGMIEFEVTFRSDWPPVAPNDFLEVAVRTNSQSGQVDNFNGFTTQFEIPES